MKTKSIYHARMTKQQALITLTVLQNHLNNLRASTVAPEDVTKMAEIVAVSGLIEQVSAEVAQAA